MLVAMSGLVLENWRAGREKHIWLSIGSDLRIDARRDLDDVGANHIAVQPLNKLPYGTLASSKVRASAVSSRLCPQQRTPAI